MGAGGQWLTRLVSPLPLGNASVRTGTGRAGGLAAGPRSEQPGHRPARSLLQDDELKYTLKRLVEGLGATREAARPGFSLALAQVSVPQRGSEPSAASVHAWGFVCCLCKAGGLPSGLCSVHMGGKALTITVAVLNCATLL